MVDEMRLQHGFGAFTEDFIEQEWHAINRTQSRKYVEVCRYVVTERCETRVRKVKAAAEEEVPSG